MLETLDRKINEALEKAMAELVRRLVELARSCDVEFSNVTIDSKIGQFKINGKIRITLLKEEEHR